MATSASRQPKTSPNTHTPPQPEADAVEAVAPKKKRSLLKIALLAILPLGGAGGGAWYFLQGAPANAAHTPATIKAVAVKREPAKPPVFVPLESFTVNLEHDDASSQYLQVGLSLKLTDETLVDAIKLHMPEIRNRVLLLLSSKKASEISTLAGKNELSAELKHAVAQSLAGDPTARALDSVLFTSFVIQ